MSAALRSKRSRVTGGSRGTGDEIAALVSYRAGPGAGFVTGASLMIDGGFTA